MNPPSDLLQKVASFLPKRKHCVQLARSLSLGETFVNQLSEGEFMASTAALSVLLTWRREKSDGATGKALFDALAAINKRDVALRFAEGLLGRGKTPVEANSLGAQGHVEP